LRFLSISAGIILAFLSCALAFQSAQPSRRPHFTNIAPRSTFVYVTNNDLSPRKYFPQPIAGGVAIFDFDNDGKMDIFFTNGAKLPELKKTGPSFYNCLLRNKGDGTFEDVTKKAGLLGENLDYNTGGAIGDYDNDGYLDLVVSNYTWWTPQTDKRCSAGGVEYYCDPRLFYQPVPNRLFHNLGHGAFEDVTKKSGFAKAPGKGMGISIADFNGDGWQDVFIANDTEANSLFINKGDGTFEDQALQLGVAYDDTAKAVSSMGSDAKDYNNDGRVDIVYNNLMGQIWALFQNSGDFFRYMSPQTKLRQLSEPLSGWSTGFIDYDNDGWKDLYSANGDVDNIKPNARQHDTMFQNLGGKEFQDVSSEMGKDFLRSGFQRGAAFVDLNNDGFPDIVVTSLNERQRILVNSADNGTHWVVLELRGRMSNRDAIGAKVKLTTGSGRVLHNHVSVSVGVISSSDKRVFFGLRSAKPRSSI